ncbi:MAG TPA: DUF3105 domain-containing protein [Candidatus Limnocylindrales bacterium]
MERNRSRLIWAGVLVVILAFGGLVYLNVTAPAYACSNQWVAPATAAPAGSPAPGSSTTIGFTQPDMGNSHVPPGTAVKYLYCPPASGNHYFSGTLGPIPARVYGPNEKTMPEGWVHNLEHGALVIAYNCSGSAPGDGCDAATQTAFGTFYSNFPNSPVCDIPAGQVGPVITRFDTMAYPFVAMVWDWVLPFQTFDAATQQQILAFYAQHAEQNNPELLCTPPSAEPSTVPTEVPTAAPATEPPASPAPAAS